MGKSHKLARRRRASKGSSRAHQWHLPHLMVAAGILVALVASVPVGAYLKADTTATGGTATQTQVCQPPSTGVHPNCVGPVGAPVTDPNAGKISCASANGAMLTPAECTASDAAKAAATAAAAAANTATGTVNTSTTTFMCNGVPVPNGTACTQTGATGTMQPCAAGQIPSAALPCMLPVAGSQSGVAQSIQGCASMNMDFNPTTSQCMPKGGTGTVVDTIDGCKAKGMGWDAANSRCTSGTAMTGTGTIWCAKLNRNTVTQLECDMASNSTADCWNEANLARHSSVECTAARAAANAKTQSMKPCPAGTYPTAAYPCMASTQGDMYNQQNKSMTPPAGMVECPGKTMSGYPMYAVDQNACAKMLADQVKWQAESQSSQTFWCPMLGRMATSTECAPKSGTNMEGQYGEGQMYPMPAMPFKPMFNYGTKGMPGSEGMEGQGNHESINKAYENQGPFKGYNYGKAFDEYQVNFDQEYDFGKVNAKRELPRLKKTGEQILKQVAQMEKELDRSIKRAGGLSTCPPIAKGQAAIASVKTVGEMLKAVTEANIDAALTAEKQLGFGGMGMGGFGGSGFGGGMPPPMPYGGMGGGYGTPSYNQGGYSNSKNYPSAPSTEFGPQSSPQSSNVVAQAYPVDADYIDPQDTLWSKAMMAVGQTHMCEGLTHMGKEVERLTREIAMLKEKTSDADLTAQLVALEVKVTGLLDYSKIDFDMEPGENPMEEISFEFQGVHMELDAIRKQVFAFSEEEGVCSQLTRMSEMFVQFKDDMPANQAAKIQAGIVLGNGACKDGDIGKAKKAVQQLMQFSDYVADIGGDEENAFEIQVEDKFIKEKAEGISAKAIAQMEKRFADLEAQLKAANNTIALLNEQLTDLYAEVAKVLNPSTDTKAALKTAANLPEVSQNAVIDNIQGSVQAGGALIKALKDAGATAADIAKIEGIVNAVAAAVLPDEQNATFIAETDKFAAQLATETDSKILSAEVTKFIVGVKTILGDVNCADKVKEGLAAALDMCNTGSWATAPVMTALQCNIVKGTPAGNMEPGKNVNGGEMVAMLAGAFLTPAEIAAATESQIPGIATLPWANRFANALVNSGKITVAELQVTVGTSFANVVTRANAAELIVAVVGDDLPPPTSAAITGVADASSLKTLSQAEQLAIKVLNQNKILNGLEKDGLLYINPAGILTKDQLITLVVKTFDLVLGTENCN